MKIPRMSRAQRRFLIRLDARAARCTPRCDSTPLRDSALYTADESDTKTLKPSLEAARENANAARDKSTKATDDDGDDAPPAADNAPRPTVEVVADKGYHEVELLFDLGRAQYRTYIPSPEQKGQRKFADKGGMLAREAFHNNRLRVQRTKAKRLLRRRGELIERTFYARETGGHRRTRLRGRDNARKRYIAHVAVLNLELVMRTLFGCGTPRQAAQAALGWLQLWCDATRAHPTTDVGTVVPRSRGHRKHRVAPPLRFCSTGC